MQLKGGIALVRELLFVFSFLTASYLVGFLFYTLLNWKSNLIHTFCWGIIVLFAVFQVIAYPMLKFRCSFSLLFIVFSVVLTGLLLLSLYFFFKKNHIRCVLDNISGMYEEIKIYPVIFVFFVFLLLLLAYLCIFLYHPTRDDGFYLARSMEILESNTLDVHPSVSWYGDYLDGYPEMTDASTLALFISFFSRLFHLHPAILCRRGFAFVMILAHLASVLTAFGSTAEYRRDRDISSYLFLTLYILFMLLARKVNSAGVWLVNYIWQGKAILIAVIFPMLLSSCSYLIKNIETIRPCEWVSVALVLTAGLFVSTVGLFLPLILFFSYGAAFLLFTKFKNFKKVIAPALLCVIPVLVTGIVSYCEIMSINTHYIGLGQTEVWSWWEEFLRAEDLFQFFLFAASVIYFAVVGSGRQRILFVAAPVILFVTFLNPFLAGTVATYVTTPEVYFRLFWLLPVYLLPAFALADLLSHVFGKNLQKAVLSIAGAFLILFGFDSSEYDIIRPDFTRITSLFDITAAKRETSYGVSAESTAIADCVLSDWTGSRRPHLLTKYDDYFELRQYSVSISTRWESLYHAVYFDPVSDITESFFSDYDQMTDYESLHRILEKVDTDYICLEHMETDFSQFGFEALCDTDSLTVWKVLKSSSTGSSE